MLYLALKQKIMKHFIIKSLLIAALSATILSCTKDNSIDSQTVLNGYAKLKEGYALGASAKVEIWGKKNFFAGYNNLVVVLYDSLNPTQKITDAHIHFMPIMTMGAGSLQSQYSAPVENPDETPVNDVFPGAVTFIMPTSIDGSWTLGVGVHNHELAKEGEAEFNINVENSTIPDLIIFKSQKADSSNLVLSLISPMVPKVGINDIEFTIHSTVDMMDFLPDDSYTFEISTGMTGMGANSTANIVMANTGNGHYKGKINMNMKGVWQINALLKKDGTTISKNSCFNFTL